MSDYNHLTYKKNVLIETNCTLIWEEGGGGIYLFGASTDYTKTKNTKKNQPWTISTSFIIQSYTQHHVR